MVIESRFPCMQKCTLFSASRACLLPSRSRFKGLNGGFHSGFHTKNAEHQNLQKAHSIPDEQQQMSNRRSPKGASPLRGVFQGPGCNKRSQKLKKSKNARSQKRSPSSEGSSSGEASGSETSGRDSPLPPGEIMPVITEGSGGGSRGWHSRRRDPRMNGADIYVARITKNGLGNARPCWRCLEWCKWAGVKRIFHWNEETNQFDVVKVNNAQPDQYETHADIRLFAGLVRPLCLF